MAEELTGEEKLRIVLESIIRSVPKAEQCEKYNVSEDDFDVLFKCSENFKAVADPPFFTLRTDCLEMFLTSGIFTGK